MRRIRDDLAARVQRLIAAIVPAESAARPRTRSSEFALLECLLASGDRVVSALGEPDYELKELGWTLDDLFARLEASFESQRRFVANASHELRTPLAGQRTLIQVALADLRASAETLRSTCERGIERWEVFDLAEVAGSVLASRRREAEDRGIVVEPALTPAPMAGDPRLVESLVAKPGRQRRAPQPAGRARRGRYGGGRGTGQHLGPQHRTGGRPRRGRAPVSSRFSAARIEQLRRFRRPR